MKRIVWTALLAVLMTAPAVADQPETMAEQYRQVLAQVQEDPGHGYAVLQLLPPTDVEDQAERDALDAVVDALAEAVEESPDAFDVRFNYHRVLWRRFLYYQTADDGKQALAQLTTLAEVVDPGSMQQARAKYERAAAVQTLLEAVQHETLPADLAAQVAEGDPTEVAIAYFEAARDAAPPEGWHDMRSALELGRLYYASDNDLDKAERFLRNALGFDEDRGYVTNQAYDLLGRIELARGRPDRALIMLNAAADVTPDSSLLAEGFAGRLAIDLIKLDHTQEVLGYLEKVNKMTDEHEGQQSPHVNYALALGYTRRGQKGPALLFWQRYLEMSETGPGADARRERAQKEVDRIITEGID